MYEIVLGGFFEGWFFLLLFSFLSFIYLFPSLIALPVYVNFAKIQDTRAVLSDSVGGMRVCASVHICGCKKRVKKLFIYINYFCVSEGNKNKQIKKQEAYGPHRSPEKTKHV